MGEILLRTGLALLGTSLLAVAVLWGLRRQLGGASSTGALRVVARLSLEPRRSLYLVEAAGRFLLVGVGDGPMNVLAELTAAEAARIEAEAGAGSTGSLLLRLGGR